MSRNLWIALVCLIFSAGSAFAQEVTKAPTTGSVKSAPQDSAQQDKAREQKLADYLSGVKFVGSFTVTGSAERPPEPESYYILSAEKMDDGDWWKLTARIKYSTYDLTVPMAMEIKWAGETPVITVDQMAVPGMGTFDARVLIRKGSYAGTWAHDQVGGQLFGRLEKMTAEELAEVKAEAEKARDK
jgi:uncharacterized OB-fold protein